MTSPRIVFSSRASTGNDAEVTISNQNRAMIVKDDFPFEGDWKVVVSNCRDTTIYIGATVDSVSITNCKDCEVVCMLVMNTLTLSSCGSVVVRCVARSIVVDSSASCSLYTFTQQPPKMAGHARDITVAPFNVVWSKHMKQTHSVDWVDMNTLSMWASGLDSSVCSILDPSQFRLTFFPDFSVTPINTLAVPIPEKYELSIRNKSELLDQLRRRILSTCTETNLHKVNAILAGHFREWLTSSRKARCMADIVNHYNQ